jgi:hypothetical protein
LDKLLPLDKLVLPDKLVLLVHLFLGRPYYNIYIEYNMDLIPLRNNLFHDVRLAEIVEKIYNRLQELKLIDKKYIGDAEFILYLMNMIEHLVSKKDGIDKKELLLSIYKNHYGATPVDILLIEKIIEFLHKNKSVKKVSYYKIFKTSLKEWFLKK